VSLALYTGTNKPATVTLVKEEEQASTFNMRTIDNGEASLMSEEEVLPIDDELVTSYPMTYNTANKKYETVVQEAGIYSVIAEAENHVPYTISNINVDSDKSFTVTLKGGDVNGDGKVNASDLGDVLRHYHSYSTEFDATGDGYVDWQDLFVVRKNFNISSSYEGLPPVAESGVVSFDLDFEECVTYDTGDPAYKLIVSVSDSLGKFRVVKNALKFDNSVVIPVNYYDGTIPDYEGDEDADCYPIQTHNNVEGLAQCDEDPTWNFDGKNSSVSFVVSDLRTKPNKYWVYEIYFKLADGKTLDDVTSDTFGFDFIAYANETAYYYGHNDASLNTITVNSNVGK
jgi:hypothetical protein